MIVFGNCFGLMPLQNFWSRDSVMLQFKYRSWNFLYSLSMQVCIFAFVFTSFYKQFVFRVEFDKISKFPLLSTQHFCVFCYLFNYIITLLARTKLISFRLRRRCWFMRTLCLWRNDGRNCSSSGNTQNGCWPVRLERATTRKSCSEKFTLSLL